MKQDGNLGEFLDREVYPALWDRLDGAFPEFGFVRKGEHWEATAEATTRSLPDQPRPGRIQAYKNTPWGFKIHGGEFVCWPTHINQGVMPRGREFIDNVRKLADLAGVSFPELELSPTEAQRVEGRQRKQELLETYVSTCQAALHTEEGTGARGYLVQRGFPEDQWEALAFGLCPCTSRSAWCRSRCWRSSPRPSPPPLSPSSPGPAARPPTGPPRPRPAGSPSARWHRPGPSGTAARRTPR